LPLAFRFAASFGLIILHLSLPSEPGPRPQGEAAYLLLLLLMFGESAWEAAHSLEHTGQIFANPTNQSRVRFNLVLDALLVTLVIAFHGVDQERLATIYIFPVLASAFYLRIPEIVAVGCFSAFLHITSVLLFTTGVLPAFGHSGPSLEMDQGKRTFILGFASLQIFAATLVVVLIRKHLETLRSTLVKSEAAVDELATLHRRVVESMFSGLVTTDMEGRITSANPAAEAIFKKPLPPGAPLPELEMIDFREFEHSTREHRFERNLTRSDGSRLIIGGNVAPLRDAEGTQTGHLLLFQDLTEIKMLEDRTKLSERLAAAGELSSEMAHELRNPMASILGCVQILKQPGQPPSNVERALTILARESERVSEILSHFLDFTRPRPVRAQALWFPTLLEELRASWETDTRNEGISLDTGLPPRLWIRGDPLCFHQVFTNLLSNARKALADTERPTIHFAYARHENTLQIDVRDNGVGMNDEQIRAIFMPFSSSFPEGTGLGMSLVFQFVQRMGWDIQVKSALGEGTTVQLTIPLGPENQDGAGN
jgi:two-component system sensor histidine kinase PilS (NtrC family)